MTTPVDYIVATTGRTGSNLLQRLTRNNGLADPNEWFHPDLFGFRRACEEGVTCEAWLERMRREQTVGGVFGSKIMATHPRDMRPHMAHKGPFADDMDVLACLYPQAKYIYLWREDVDRQALSFFRAKTTGQWTRWKNAAGEEGASPPALDVDFVERDVRHIAMLNRRWEQYFGRHGIEPLRLTYERLDADRAGVIREVGAFLGRPIAGEPVLDVEIVRQADDVTERYLRELREHRAMAGSAMRA